MVCVVSRKKALTKGAEVAGACSSLEGKCRKPADMVGAGPWGVFVAGGPLKRFSQALGKPNSGGLVPTACGG